MTPDLLTRLRAVGDPIVGGVPAGDPAEAWQHRALNYRLVSPLNRRKFTVIVVGTGLAGAGCAAALGELGYHVECFTFHDAPRRAHSVRRPGRYQRRPGTQGRQRQRRPVRQGHRQGRGLPRPGGRLLSARSANRHASSTT